MSALNQKTIKDQINFSGVGLHGGQIVKVTIKPSDPNSGIVFKRIDIKDNNLIIPNFSNEYRLGTANTDTNYNVAIIRSDALIIHTEDFLKTEVNWFK